MTIRDVSNHLGVSWDTVKEIHSSYLKHYYSPLSLAWVKIVDIKEFTARKGHVYKTIAVNLDSGWVIYVGAGKCMESLTKF